MKYIFHEVDTRTYVVEEMSMQEWEFSKYLRFVHIFENAGGRWP